MPPVFDERVIDACVAEFAVFGKLLYSNLACLLHIYLYFVSESIVPQRSDGSDLFLLFIYFLVQIQSEGLIMRSSYMCH